MNKFWMVYVEGQNAPAYKHYSVESASKEAERLAGTTGLVAYVLEATEAVRLNKFEHISFDVPF